MNRTSPSKHRARDALVYVRVDIPVEPRAGERQVAYRTLLPVRRRRRGTRAELFFAGEVDGEGGRRTRAWAAAPTTLSASPCRPWPRARARVVCASHPPASCRPDRRPERRRRPSFGKSASWSSAPASLSPRTWRRRRWVAPRVPSPHQGTVTRRRRRWHRQGSSPVPPAPSRRRVPGSETTPARCAREPPRANLRGTECPQPWFRPRRPP